MPTDARSPVYSNNSHRFSNRSENVNSQKETHKKAATLKGVISFIANVIDRKAIPMNIYLSQNGSPAKTPNDSNTGDATQ